MNLTNEPSLKSWIPVPEDSHFPIQNLPMGAFRRPDGTPGVGVAIGDYVLDLSRMESQGLLDVRQPRREPLFAGGKLNRFLELGPSEWHQTRALVSRLLQEDEPAIRDNPIRRRQLLLDRHSLTMVLPCEIGDYTDFYSSREHATNVGTMLRGADQALQPNWLHLPVAYHGRSSSIVASGTEVIRPHGQRKPELSPMPIFGPTKSLDFELEIAAVVGPGNHLGDPIPVTRARDHIFGLVLLNDWSARDIQGWEYVPLGPFLGKNFCTTISPWIVPLEALEPWRVEGPAQEPTPLPYLRVDGKETWDIHLEVLLKTPMMSEPVRISRTNYRSLYWALAQQIAHHTINGCNLRAGDLLASGTISGPSPDSLGCLLELTSGGRKPLQLPDGEKRAFLMDGDTLTLTGWCQGKGYRVGFGEATGVIAPARKF